MTRDFQEMTGQRYGSFLVIEVYPRERDSWGRLKPARAMCQCDCGNSKIMNCSDILNGKIKSCGCQRGNISGKKHTFYKRALRCYRCQNPDAICTYSSVLKVCCWECPKRDGCGMACNNRPEKCGAKQYLASEEVRDFLTQKKEVDV